MFLFWDCFFRSRIKSLRSRGNERRNDNERRNWNGFVSLNEPANVSENDSAAYRMILEMRCRHPHRVVSANAGIAVR